jgi:hypothetical protein
MKEPYSLYVDDLSPDEIKATVSDVGSYWHNLTALRRLPGLEISPVYRSFSGERINGVHIMPMGRFICMLVGGTGKRGMILLDLIDKEELAEEIAAKFGNADLHDRFMEVYDEVISHPENHQTYKLVVGKPKAKWIAPVRR